VSQRRRLMLSAVVAAGLVLSATPTHVTTVPVGLH
jgi:hypothetical protein